MSDAPHDPDPRWAGRTEDERPLPTGSLERPLTEEEHALLASMGRGRDGRSTDVASGLGAPHWLLRQINYCQACGAELVLSIPPTESRERLSCPSCGFIAYVNPKLVVTAIPVNDRGECVLLRRGIEPAYGTWAQPGGFLEVDETVAEGTVREVLEEQPEVLRGDDPVVHVDVGPVVGDFGDDRPVLLAATTEHVAGLVGGGAVNFRHSGPDACDLGRGERWGDVRNTDRVELTVGHVRDGRFDQARVELRVVRVLEGRALPVDDQVLVGVADDLRPDTSRVVGLGSVVGAEPPVGPVPDRIHRLRLKHDRVPRAGTTRIGGIPVGTDRLGEPPAERVGGIRPGDERRVPRHGDRLARRRVKDEQRDREGCH